MHSRFFRHVFLGLLLGLGSVACQKKTVAGPAINQPPQPSAPTSVNPLLASGPDPWVYQKDGFYYFLTTIGGDVRIRKSATPVFVKNPLWLGPTDPATTDFSSIGTAPKNG